MLNVENILYGSHVESQRLAVGQVSSRRSSGGRLEVPLSISVKSSQTDTDLLTGEPCADSIPVWATAPSILKLEKILLPFDFSAASVQLLRVITSLVEKLGVKLTIVHVVSPWVPPTGREAPYPYDPNEERLDTGRVLLKRLLRSVCSRHESLSAHVVVGRPTDDILQFARNTKPDLIAMATHGPRVLKHLFVSATTERVTRQARCPVLVVPEAVLMRREKINCEEVRPERPRIVVPTDFSANSVAALRFAGSLAEAQKAELHVLNFFDRRALLPQASRVRVDEWVKSNLPLAENVTATVCEGQPSVYMLIRQAELLKADLIVLGPRGYAWAERFRLNSTTDGILRNASCPVLSLRAGTHPAGH